MRLPHVNLVHEFSEQLGLSMKGISPVDINYSTIKSTEDITTFYYGDTELGYILINSGIIHFSEGGKRMLTRYVNDLLELRLERFITY